MRVTLIAALLSVSILAAASVPVHVWERQALTFTGARSFDNPYTDVTVWVDLRRAGILQADLRLLVRRQDVSRPSRGLTAWKLELAEWIRPGRLRICGEEPIASSNPLER